MSTGYSLKMRETDAAWVADLVHFDGIEITDRDEYLPVLRMGNNVVERFGRVNSALHRQNSHVGTQARFIGRRPRHHIENRSRLV